MMAELASSARIKVNNISHEYMQLKGTLKGFQKKLAHSIRNIQMFLIPGPCDLFIRLTFLNALNKRSPSSDGLWAI